MCSFCGDYTHVPDEQAAGSAGGASASANPPTFSLTQVIAQLRTSWGGQWENDTYPFGPSPIQYAVMTTTPLDSSPENSGFAPMTALMASRAAEAFELWDELIAVSMNPYAGAPPANAEIIQFAYSSATDGGGTYEYGASYSYQGPNQYGGEQWNQTRAEIWLNTDWSTHSTSSPLNQSGYGYYGGYGFLTYLHEIGHALGLSHPGSYDASDGTPVTYADDAEFAQDTHRYTVMSYFYADEDGSGTDHYAGTGFSDWRYAQTPMLYDIAAIQAIYGADLTTRASNTTYGFNNTSGLSVFDFSLNTRPIVTIWDGGGTDTLDLSGFSGTQRIDLNPGTFSDIDGFMTNNLAIAYNVIIEVAYGGSGIDSITGNSAGNTIYGNAGNDVISGGAGNDILYGGSNTDIVVFGGNSSDYQVSFNSSTNTYTLVDLRSGSPDETDQVNGFETYRFANGDFASLTVNNSAIVGTAGNDTLIGTSGNDTIYGLDSNDTLEGGAGADYLDGGAGIDIASYLNAPLSGGTWPGVYARLDMPSLNTGHAAGDTYVNIEGLSGSNFDDLLIGNDSSNQLHGNGGQDSLFGLGGNDEIYAGDGSDHLWGFAGADILDGQAGFNLARYDYSSIGLTAMLDNAAMNTGEAIGDTYLNIQGLVGSMLNDTLVGNGGANNLYGNDGGDSLYGRLGDDYLNGGPGNDSLFGEFGSDFLVGGPGADALNGGDGFDYAGYDSASSGVTARLDGTAGNLGEAAGDTYISIEGLMGSNFNDVLIGNSSANTIYGLNGNDMLVGGGGNDTLIGGGGSDTFVFNAPSGVTTIQDFTSGSDVLQISVTGFGHGLIAGTAPTVVQVSSFDSASNAGGSGYFIFDNFGSSIGALYWDQTGGSGTDAMLVANLQNLTSLAAANFILV